MKSMRQFAVRVHCVATLICGFLPYENQNDICGEVFREPNGELVTLPVALQE
jgi:hypothetical protein